MSAEYESNLATQAEAQEYTAYDRVLESERDFWDSVPECATLDY